jgi:hypothetical protein
VTSPLLCNLYLSHLVHAHLLPLLCHTPLRREPSNLTPASAPSMLVAQVPPLLTYFADDFLLLVVDCSGRGGKACALEGQRPPAKDGPQMAEQQAPPDETGLGMGGMRSAEDVAAAVVAAGTCVKLCCAGATPRWRLLLPVATDLGSTEFFLPSRIKLR